MSRTRNIYHNEGIGKEKVMSMNSEGSSSEEEGCGDGDVAVLRKPMFTTSNATDSATHIMIGKRVQQRFADTQHKKFCSGI